MTKKQRNYKQALIKAVHTSLMYKGIFAHNRDMYEDFLENHFGVKSSKDLSIGELKKLVDYLNHKSDKIETDRASDNQIAYLVSVWMDKSSEKTYDSLIAFSEKILKKKVKNLEQLSKKEASKMIAVVNNLRIRNA